MMGWLTPNLEFKKVTGCYHILLRRRLEHGEIVKSMQTATCIRKWKSKYHDNFVGCHKWLVACCIVTQHVVTHKLKTISCAAIFVAKPQ